MTTITIGCKATIFPLLCSYKIARERERYVPQPLHLRIFSVSP